MNSSISEVTMNFPDDMKIFGLWSIEIIHIRFGCKTPYDRYYRDIEDP